MGRIYFSVPFSCVLFLVVGHQAIRINPAAKPGFPFLKCVEIKEVIFVSGKNDLTIMPPLNDMVGEVGDD